MKNVLSTIPKSRYYSWNDCQADLESCDGDEGGFWLINVARKPLHADIGSLCYMIFDGQIRGYMDVVDAGLTESFRNVHRIGKKRNTYSLVMANWHPIDKVIYKKGFQGYRYTELRP